MSIISDSQYSKKTGTYEMRRSPSPSVNLSRSCLSPPIISGAGLNQSLSLTSLDLSGYSVYERTMASYASRGRPRTRELPPLSAKIEVVEKSPSPPPMKAINPAEFSFIDLQKARKGKLVTEKKKEEPPGRRYSTQKQPTSPTVHRRQLRPEDFGIPPSSGPGGPSGRYAFSPMRGKCLSRSIFPQTSSFGFLPSSSVMMSVDSTLSMDLTEEQADRTNPMAPSFEPAVIDVNPLNPRNLLETPSSAELRVGIPDDVSVADSHTLSPPRLSSAAIDPPSIPFDDEVALQSAEGSVEGEEGAIGGSEASASEAAPVTTQAVNPNISLDISDAKPSIVSLRKPLPKKLPPKSNPSRLAQLAQTRPVKRIEKPVKLAEPSLLTKSVAESHSRTVGGDHLAPFAPHRRILGWKLTSVQRRKHMIDILDAVHGQVHPSQLKLLKRRIKHEMQSGSLAADSMAFVPPEFVESMQQTAPQSPPGMWLDDYLRSQQQPSSAQSNARPASSMRETLAMEHFVERMNQSRQGFKNVTQIRGLMEHRQRRKLKQQQLMEAQKEELRRRQNEPPKPRFVSPFVGEFGFAEYIPRPQSKLKDSSRPESSAQAAVSRAVTAHPYIAAGTLAASDHLAPHEQSVSLKALLAETLFGPESPPPAAQLPPLHGLVPAGERSRTPKEMYDFPLSIHRPRSRMDIHEAVLVRQELEPVLRQESSWKEDQLVDAFIAGRQNARLRRSRERGEDGRSYSGEDDFPSRPMSQPGGQPMDLAAANSGRGGDLLSEVWDEESLLSMSTTAEDNEAALSEALMEHFGLSLHDDEEDDNTLGNNSGLIDEALRELQTNSALFSEDPNNLTAPSVHPLQPTSPANSFRYSPDRGDDNNSRGGSSLHSRDTLNSRGGGSVSTRQSRGGL